jgi:hypothetical protein
MVSASRIFDSPALNGTVHAERHDVFSGWFSSLRSSLRRMAHIWHEADDPDALETVGYIQRTLSEWLTVPIAFDEALTDKLEPLGTPAFLERRWGADMGNLCQAALDAAAQLRGMANPLAVLVGERICQLQANQVDFRVFCHRSAVPAFNQLIAAAGGTALPPEGFLHSCRDYRECVPFETLVKVGPLRARGWGAVPDALITAPRFTRLLQFVWSGCFDEPEFGYDPVSSSAVSGAPLPQTEAMPSSPMASALLWSRQVHQADDADDTTFVTPPPDDDEFRMFREFRETTARESRQAVLVQVNDEHGILYPPLARVLCFDPSQHDAHCLGYRVVGDSLTETCFVIRPSLQTEGAGTLQAQHGRFSQIWKSCLRRRLEENARALIHDLDAAGLDLTWLSPALHHWARPPTTVIHAPQQKRHFEILMRVLKADFTSVAPARFRDKPLWQFAWQEVCHSRGEAIHAGFVNHAQEEESLREVLVSMVAEIRGLAAAGSSFTLALPGGRAVAGTAFFDRVVAIEDGFRASDQNMRVVHHLNEIEKWRV